MTVSSSRSLFLLLAVTVCVAAHVASVSGAFFARSPNDLPTPPVVGIYATVLRGSVYSGPGSFVDCGPAPGMAVSHNAASSFDSFAASNEKSGQLVTFNDAIYMVGAWNCGLGSADRVLALNTSTSTWTESAQVAALPRTGHGVAVKQYPAPTLCVVGGQMTSDFNLGRNDVWCTSGDPMLPASWVQKPSAPWSARYHFGTAVTSTDQVVVVGGRSGSSVFSDVWLSDVLLHTWTLQTAAAGFGAVAGPGMVMAQNRLYLAGGSNVFGDDTNSVWMSANNGANWTQLAVDGGFSPRYEPRLLAIGSKLMLLGGTTGGVPTNDVYTAFV